MMIFHLSNKFSPEAITPQENAHIGGNHVIGLSNSVNANKEIFPICVFSS
jgi:hypothetical protein